MLYFMDYEADWYQGDILSITSSTNGSGVGSIPKATWQTKRKITTSDSIIISKVSDNKYNLYLEAKGSYTILKIYYMTSESVGAKDSDLEYELFNTDAWASTAPTITSRSSLANHSSHTNNINGGAAGSIPYQSATNTTAFLAKGTANQVLKMNSSGTVPIWANEKSYSAATTSAAGLMSAADKTKLDGIEANSNKYTLPVASSSALGGIKIGTTVSTTVQNTNRRYAVNVISEGDDGWAYVDVPWTDNDTKNTAGSTNSTSKMYLIGATSQGANPQTYSNSAVYATNGELTATKFIGSLTGNVTGDVSGKAGDSEKLGNVSASLYALKTDILGFFP